MVLHRRVSLVRGLLTMEDNTDIEYSGGCYTDLSSACGQPGAVSCTQLGPNTNKACCPANTVCAPGYNATNDFVRCNIPSSSLSSLAATSTSLQGVSAATSRTSLSVSTQDNGQIITVTPSGGNVPSTTSSRPYTAIASPDPESTKTSTYTTPTTTPTPTPSPDTFTLTAGDIAGIAIGSAGAVLLVLAGAWYIRRRRRRAPSNRDEITSRQMPPAYDDKAVYGSYTSPDVRAELSSQRDPSELPHHPLVKYNQSPQELEG